MSIINIFQKGNKCCFEDAKSFTMGIAPVKKDGKWGFIHKNGSFFVEPIFEDADNFSECYAKVKQNGKWGFIDIIGRWFINPVFDNVGNFCEGLAYFQIYKQNQGAYGYLDINGKIVIPQVLYSASNFSEGLAAVQKDNKKLYIDIKGNIKIDNQTLSYPYHNFSEGLARVGHSSHYCFIDKQGNIIIDLRCNVIKSINKNCGEVGDFNEGLAWFQDFSSNDKNGKIGYIDKTGKIIIKPFHTKAYNFFEGLALVEKWEGTSEPTRRYINNDGKIIIDLATDFTDAGDFSNGLAFIRKNKKYGYIDKTGKIVIKPQFEWPSNFSEGLAYVRKNGKYGFIDKSGKILI
ncbi:MAG: WG repeat-containing protein [Ignavibacteriales bacterium]|nr:WG repeat-containing protein [Ignavibacteriales bacterium]